AADRVGATPPPRGTVPDLAEPLHHPPAEDLPAVVHVDRLGKEAHCQLTSRTRHRSPPPPGSWTLSHPSRATRKDALHTHRRDPGLRPFAGSAPGPDDPPQRARR